MQDTKQVLQDLIDNLDKQIIETEGILQAQQGCLVTLKRQRNYIVAKKKSIEEEEKKNEESVPSTIRVPRRRKSGRTPPIE